MLVHHTVTVLPFVALAYGGPLIGRNPKGMCNIGKIQCCQNVSTSNSPEVLNSATSPNLLDLLTTLPVNTPIGMGCSNIAGAGSGMGCNANPVCCENALYQEGLVNVGCTPISLSDL